MDPQASSITPPPPPPGYGTPSVVPPPPPGYGTPTMATSPQAPTPSPAPAQSAPADATPPPTGILGRIGSFLGDVGSAYAGYERGFGKGMVQTIAGAMNALNKDDGGSYDPKAAAAYQQQHPKASASEAIAATMHPADPQGHIHAVKAASDWLMQHSQTDGLWQKLGSFGESAAELLTPGLGEEAAGVDAAKAPGYAEKLAEMAKTAKVLQGHPKLAALAALGVRTLKAAAQGGVKGAAETGTQTYVKTGGDTNAAADAATVGGLVGAGLGAVMTPAAEAAQALIRRYATTLENVGGVRMPIPPEVRNAKPTPVQQAGQQAITNAARATYADRLGELNESRAVPPETPADRTLPASTNPQPFTFNLKAGMPTETTTGQIAQPALKVPKHSFEQPVYSHKSAPIPTRPGYEGSTGGDIATSSTPAPKEDVASGPGTIVTQDPNLAKAHVAKLNEAIDAPDFAAMPRQQQQALLEARADAQQQIAQYHQQLPKPQLNASRPNFSQIDIPTEVKKVGSYSELAQRLIDHATEGYDSIRDALGLNDITGGKFDTIRNANKAAWKAYKEATLPKDMQQAAATIDETNRQMFDLLHHDIGGAVSPKELAGFNEAYGQGQTLSYIGDAIDRAFSGNPSSSARSWEYRGFNGQQLMGSLNNLERKFGRGTLNRLMGAGNLDTLYQVAELNRTNAARGRFGQAVAPIAKYLAIHATPVAIGGFVGQKTGLGWETGAAAGLAASAAGPRVIKAVLSNPKIAQNLIFAIRSGARPENYAPMIGAMIQQQETENSRLQQAAQEQ